MGYEFVIIRFNDLNLYFRNCFADLFTSIKAIHDLFSLPGIITATTTTIDFFVNCFTKVFDNIYSWHLPIIGNEAQDVVNTLTCSANFITSIISLLTYVIEAIITSKFNFVNFFDLTESFVTDITYCLDNLLETLSLQDFLAELTQYIAAHPFTIKLPQIFLPDGSSPINIFSSSIIFHPGFVYATTPIALLVTGLKQFASVGKQRLAAFYIFF